LGFDGCGKSLIEIQIFVAMTTSLKSVVITRENFDAIPRPGTAGRIGHFNKNNNFYRWLLIAH
jgi:hypothetical protein